MVAVAGAFNQEKALVGACSVITNLGLGVDLHFKLYWTPYIELVSPLVGQHPGEGPGQAVAPPGGGHVPASVLSTGPRDTGTCDTQH